MVGVDWQWKSKEEYGKNAEKVKAIPCVNDACERSVQLASLKNKEGPKKESERQDFYMVVNKTQKMPKTLKGMREFHEKF